MNNLPETQPVITSATIVALITAAIALAVAFGVPISEEQKVALIGFVAVLAPLATIYWPQRKTTPLADPKVKVEDGTVTPLIRADTGRATPEAIKAGNVV